MDDEENAISKSSPENLQAIIFTGLKKVSLFGLVYFWGYMNFSFAWILFPIILLMFRDKSKERIRKKRNFSRAASATSEKDVILAHFDDLPAWVFFPDVERTEWLNKIIKQIWPNVNHYARDLISGPIEQSIKSNLDAYNVKGFKFDRIVLGSVPFRIGGVIVYDNISRDEIVMDLDISYAGDCDITFHLTGVKGGIKNLQLYGRLRVVMKPLISTIPLVGGLQAFFLNNPDIDFDLVGVAQVLEVPGINANIKKIVSDTISSMMVLPNKFPIQLSDEIDSAIIKSPDPKGVLRIHVVEAKDLMKKDINILGTGKSDPYAVLRVGAQEFKTKIIDNSVDPKWDAWCEFIILEHTGQQLYVHLWDHDKTDDESLGLAYLDIEGLAKDAQNDMWITLEKAKHGMVHLRLTWLSLSNDFADLDAALVETQELNVSTVSSALLTVFIDYAKDLPQVRSSSNPDPYVVLQVGKNTHQTKVDMRTINPAWEEGFTFFVPNPKLDVLAVKILDNKTDGILGELNYQISKLADKIDLEVLKGKFALLKSGSTSEITLTMRLRILKGVAFDKNTEQQDSYEFSRKQSTKSNSSSGKTPEKARPSYEKQPSATSMQSQASTLDELVFDNSDLVPENTAGVIYRKASTTSSTGLYGLGRLQLTLRYSFQRQKLIVVVHKVSSIPIRDLNDFPDVYVKLYLLPERSKDSKRKTKVIKNNPSPVFDETFEYFITQAELNSKQLQVIITAEKLMKNEVLGHVLVKLDLDTLAESLSSWYDLHPDY